MKNLKQKQCALLQKELELEEQLSKINKQMFSLPNLVWENDYHVDEEATAEVCPEYVRLADEYNKLATELNKLRHARLGLPDLKQGEVKECYIDTSVRSDTGKTWDEYIKAFLFKRSSSGLDTQIVLREIGVLKDAVTFVESKPIDLLLDRSTLVKLDSGSYIVLKDKSDVVLELIVNFIDLNKSIANVTPVDDYKGKGAEVIAFEYVSGGLDAWLPRID